MAVRARRGDPSRFHGYRATPAQRPRPSDALMRSPRGAVWLFNPSKAASHHERHVGVFEAQLSDVVRSLTPEILNLVGASSV